MNSNTALVMFAVLAALGLAVATLALPIVQEVNAQGQGSPPCKGGGGSNCKGYGISHKPLL